MKGGEEMEVKPYIDMIFWAPGPTSRSFRRPSRRIRGARISRGDQVRSPNKMGLTDIQKVLPGFRVGRIDIPAVLEMA
jgi:hypothetical protein